MGKLSQTTTPSTLSSKSPFIFQKIIYSPLRGLCPPPLTLSRCVILNSKCLRELLIFLGIVHRYMLIELLFVFFFCESVVIYKKCIFVLVHGAWLTAPKPLECPGIRAMGACSMIMSGLLSSLMLMRWPWMGAGCYGNELLELWIEEWIFQSHPLISGGEKRLKAESIANGPWFNQSHLCHIRPPYKPRGGGLESLPGWGTRTLSHTTQAPPEQKLLCFGFCPSVSLHLVVDHILQ